MLYVSEVHPFFAHLMSFSWLDRSFHWTQKLLQWFDCNLEHRESVCVDKCCWKISVPSKNWYRNKFIQTFQKEFMKNLNLSKNCDLGLPLWFRSKILRSLIENFRMSHWKRADIKIGGKNYADLHFGIKGFDCCKFFNLHQTVKYYSCMFWNIYSVVLHIFSEKWFLHHDIVHSH